MIADTKTRKGGEVMAKYQDWLEEDKLTLIEGWARSGLTDEQIAHNIGIRRETLYAWIKKYPNISNALKKGKEVADFEVENALFKSAKGYEYEEVKTYIEDSGSGHKKRIEKTKKHIAPNVTAQIFWLKNRKPDKWRDRKETALSGEIKTNTNPFDGIDTEVLEKLAENAKRSV